MSWTHGISGYVMKCRCAVCRSAHRAYHTARNKARYDRGQCRHCDEDRVATSVLCDGCLSHARDYQQARSMRVRQTQEAA